jgi:hypothetical protein
MDNIRPPATPATTSKIVRAIRKEIAARSSNREIDHKDHNDCEWHDAGTGDCENN